MAAVVSFGADAADLLTYFHSTTYPWEKGKATAFVPSVALPATTCAWTEPTPEDSEDVDVWLSIDDGCWTKSTGPIANGSSVRVLVRYFNGSDDPIKDMNLVLGLDSELSLLDGTTSTFSRQDPNGSFDNSDLFAYSGVNIGTVSSREASYALAEIEVGSVYFELGCGSDTFIVEARAVSGFLTAPPKAGLVSEADLSTSNKCF